MSFDFFRKHQKKIMAFLVILAMFLFTIDQSVYFLFSDRAPARDKVEVQLFGKSVYSSDLQRFQSERLAANSFLEAYFQLKFGFGMNGRIFGDVTQRACVDGLILQKKADELGIPANAELGKDFLRGLGVDFSSSADLKVLAEAKKRSNPSITDEVLLATVAKQFRIATVERLMSAQQTTPWDIFQGFRDRHEQVSALATGFKVEDFVAQVKAEPKEEDLKAYFDKYKSALSNPDSATPGFKSPRKIRVLYASIDAKTIGEKIKTDLIKEDKELRAYFESRKKDLTDEINNRIKEDLAAGQAPSELPVEVFAPNPAPPADPKAPAPKISGEQTSLSFVYYQDRLADELIRQKLETLVAEEFNKLEKAVISPIITGYDKARTAYDDRLESSKEIKSESGTDADSADDADPNPSLATLWNMGLDAVASDLLKTHKVEGAITAANSPDMLAKVLTEIAKTNKDVVVGVSAPLDRSKLVDFKDIGESLSGSDYSMALISSADSFEKLLFGGEELYVTTYNLVDRNGKRYAAWRVQDTPESVPAFEDVKADVAKAWKFNEARSLAKAKAEEFAKQVREKAGDIRGVASTTNLVVKELPLTEKIQKFGQTERPNPLAAIDDQGGKALRDAVFGLKKAGDVNVAANEPETMYYAVSYFNRLGSSVADFAGTAHATDASSARQEVNQQAMQTRMANWRDELRKEAGLAADWKPSDETKRTGSAKADEEPNRG